MTKTRNVRTPTVPTFAVAGLAIWEMDASVSVRTFSCESVCMYVFGLKLCTCISV